MRELTEIYRWFENEGVFLFERQLPFSDERSRAVTIQLPSAGVTGVFLDRRGMTQAEEKTALLHEEDTVQPALLTAYVVPLI